MSNKIPANKYLLPKELAKKLNIALDNNLNVALIGKHGVGKTSTIISVLKERNVKFLYFSGATLDPWVDFVGIPIKSTDPNGQSHIDYLRPKELLDPELEVIIIDEFNRSPKKVRNAVMELIQFKSINGKKFPKLRCVWTGINPPEDGEYDVEDLDPAQLDRFEMQIYVAYKPDPAYFTKKYPAGNSLVNWWNSQSDEIKNGISPRRLEYIASALANNNSAILEDILPKSLGSTEISKIVALGSEETVLKELKDMSDEVTKTIANDHKKFSKYLPLFITNPTVYKKFQPHLPEEYHNSIVSTSNLSTEVKSIVRKTAATTTTTANLSLVFPFTQRKYILDKKGKLLKLADVKSNLINLSSQTRLKTIIKINQVIVDAYSWADDTIRMTPNGTHGLTLISNPEHESMLFNLILWSAIDSHSKPRDNTAVEGCCLYYAFMCKLGVVPKPSSLLDFFAQIKRLIATVFATTSINLALNLNADDVLTKFTDYIAYYKVKYKFYKEL